MSAASAIGTRARVVGVLVVVFVCGAATGAALTAARTRSRPDATPGLDELGLTPPQARDARAIMERHRGEVDAVLRDVYPRLEPIDRAVESELRALLTPEQRARMDALRLEHGGSPSVVGPEHH